MHYLPVYIENALDISLPVHVYMNVLYGLNIHLKQIYNFGTMYDKETSL
jgi:hypothetical protein